MKSSPSVFAMVVQEGRSEFEASLIYIGSSCQAGLHSEILSQRGMEGGYFDYFETFVLKLFETGKGQHTIILG